MMRVLDSGMVVQGPRVAEFEAGFAELCGVKHAVAVASGTAALWVTLLAYEIGPGDEVITTPFSFIASSNCALFVGARPVFVDVEPDTYLMDANAIESRITERTRAILPVHLYGQHLWSGRSSVKPPLQPGGTGRGSRDGSVQL